MYQAYNDNVIATLETRETSSALGIITMTDKVPRYKVLATNEISKELQDKVILTERAIELDTTHVAVNYKDILAVVK